MNAGLTVSVFVLLYLLGSSIAWAAVSPPGGPPAEGDHVVHAAGLVRGDLGIPHAVVGDAERTWLWTFSVPQWARGMGWSNLSENAFEACFAGLPERTANCAQAPSGEAITTVPTRVEQAAPIYSLVVGFPTLLLSGSNALFAMRLMSALVFVGLVGAGLAVASPTSRGWLALGVVAVATPGLTYFAGSVGPGSIQCGAAIGLMVALLGWDLHTERPRLRLVVTLSLSGLTAWAGSGGEVSLLIVAATAGLLTHATIRHSTRLTQTGLVIGTAFAALSAVAYRMWYSGQAPAPFGDPIAVGTAAYQSPAALGSVVQGSRQLHTFEAGIPSRLTDLIGSFGGPADHSAPALISTAWLFGLAALLTLSLFMARRRDRRILVGMSVMALIVMPALLATVGGGGGLNELRTVTTLALVLPLGATAVIAAADNRIHARSGATTLRAFALATPIATAATIASSLHRYSIGGTAQLSDLPSFATGFHEWLPPYHLLGVAAVALILALWAGWRIFVLGVPTEE